MDYKTNFKSNPMEQFLSAIRLVGLTPPLLIESGRFYRFPGVGKPTKNNAGWCRLFPDELGGSFGDFTSGLSEHWQADRAQQFTQEQRADFKRQVEETQKQVKAQIAEQHARARMKALSEWNNATLAPANHPYFIRKKIKPHGVRLDTQGRIIVPLRIMDEIHSLQRIPCAPEEKKKFSCVSGCGTIQQPTSRGLTAGSMDLAL